LSNDKQRGDLKLNDFFKLKISRSINSLLKNKRKFRNYFIKKKKNRILLVFI